MFLYIILWSSTWRGEIEIVQPSESRRAVPRVGSCQKQYVYVYYKGLGGSKQPRNALSHAIFNFFKRAATGFPTLGATRGPV